MKRFRGRARQRRLLRRSLRRAALLLRPALRILTRPLRFSLLQVVKLRFALEFAHMLVKRGAQIARRPPEFRHQPTQISSQFGQFFRPKYNQRDHKYDDQVRNTEHLGGVSAFERIIE